MKINVLLSTFFLTLVLSLSLEATLAVQAVRINKNLLDEKGMLLETSVPQFLVEAAKINPQAMEDFSRPDCIKAKNILKGEGGYNTLQLFIVTSSCKGTESSYIIKESRDGDTEAAKLIDIENHPGMKELRVPHPPDGLPTLALPIAFFSYKYDKTPHYISVMQTAKGKMFCNLIAEFNKDQSPANRERVKRAFTLLGKQLALFHAKFMEKKPGKILTKTIAHGDFHCYNLFYDEQDGHFTFIDNESMERSLVPLAKPQDDLVKLFFSHFSINRSYQRFRDLLAQIPLKLWFDTAFKSFNEGYASAYPVADRTQVLHDLRDAFNSPFKIPWMDFDKAQLDELRRLYINPIFDALATGPESIPSQPPQSASSPFEKLFPPDLLGAKILHQPGT